MTDKIAKGDRCKRLLDDPDLQQAFQDVRDAIHQRFEQVPVDDGASLIQLRQRLHILDSVWANLERAVQDGKLEVANLDAENKVKFLGDMYAGRSTSGR